MSRGHWLVIAVALSAANLGWTVARRDWLWALLWLILLFVATAMVAREIK
jgi:hypothetical protein